MGTIGRFEQEYQIRTSRPLVEGRQLLEQSLIPQLHAVLGDLSQVKLIEVKDYASPSCQNRSDGFLAELVLADGSRELIMVQKVMKVLYLNPIPVIVNVVIKVYEDETNPRLEVFTMDGKKELYQGDQAKLENLLPHLYQTLGRYLSTEIFSDLV